MSRTQWWSKHSVALYDTLEKYLFCRLAPYDPTFVLVLWMFLLIFTYLWYVRGSPTYKLFGLKSIVFIVFFYLIIILKSYYFLLTRFLLVTDNNQLTSSLLELNLSCTKIFIHIPNINENAAWLHITYQYFSKNKVFRV